MDPNAAPIISKYQTGQVLLVDKPLEWTSFDVVNKLRYALKRHLNVKKIKVGHAGTLDPLATGLLIICTGKATKRIDEYQGMPKEYTGTLRLGAATPSYDAETEPDQIFPTDHLTEEMLHAAARELTGFLDQLPPMFSAIKVDGQPLYKQARKGKTVERKSRRIEVMQFELTKIQLPDVDFRVTCSKGTYIRTLAHDLGMAVGSGAYLTALRRTAIGEFQVADAWELEPLVERIESEEISLEE